MAAIRKKYIIFVEFGNMAYDDVIYAENIVDARRIAVQRTYKNIKKRFPNETYCEIYFMKEGSRKPFGHIQIDGIVLGPQKLSELSFYWYKDHDDWDQEFYLDYKTGRTRSQ